MVAVATSVGESTRTPEYRAGLALAEAIIPGSSRVPPADEATYARAMEVVREFHPSAVTAFRVAVRTLDAAAVAFTGKPFHSLDAARQEQLLVRWQTDPVLKTPLTLIALVYRFVHFDRPEVYGTLGGRLNVVKNLEEPRWLSQVHRADAYPDDEVECEVVVVGTGAVHLRSYVAVDDIGNVVNPMIVEGQVHGGLAQGIAQALYEEAVYDADGNLVTGTMVDYLVPSAADLPHFTTDRTVTPATTNELGVKGVGEAGTIASTPAVVNAVVDALRHLGVDDVRMPCSPQTVWRAIQAAGAVADGGQS